MEPSTQLASCLCKECMRHCLVCGRDSPSVCCGLCTAELSSPPADTKTDVCVYNVNFCIHDGLLYLHVRN
jgi:hypothetical protein